MMNGRPYLSRDSIFSSATLYGLLRFNAALICPFYTIVQVISPVHVLVNLFTILVGCKLNVSALVTAHKFSVFLGSLNSIS